METQEKIQKVDDMARKNGWSVSVEEEENGDVRFEFQRYTMHGQDFNFNAAMSDGDVGTLIDDIRQYFGDFDPDYEAYLWIGEDGHGKCGAPYHIKDIVADMEDAEERICELLNALETEFL